MGEKLLVVGVLLALAVFAATAPAISIGHAPPITQHRLPPATPPSSSVGSEGSPAFVKIIASDDHWTTSDKIAAGALLSALLQFIVLVRTLIVTDSNSRRQLRAYVAVFERNLKFDSETQLTCVLRVKNFGQTPAFEVEECIDVWVDTYPTPSNLPACYFEPDGGQSYLPPTAEFSPYLDVYVSPEELEEILLTKKAVWASGAIRFVDAFGCRIETPFRYFMTGKDFIGADRKMNLAPDGNHPRRS